MWEISALIFYSFAHALSEIQTLSLKTDIEEARKRLQTCAREESAVTALNFSKTQLTSVTGDLFQDGLSCAITNALARADDNEKSVAQSTSRIRMSVMFIGNFNHIVYRNTHRYLIHYADSAVIPETYIIARIPLAPDRRDALKIRLSFPLSYWSRICRIWKRYFASRHSQLQRRIRYSAITTYSRANMRERHTEESINQRPYTKSIKCRLAGAIHH